MVPIHPERRGLSIEAPAKINVELKILGKDESGYHQLETHFAAVGLCDVLTIALAETGLELIVEGADLGDPRDNLVYRAATAFFAEAKMAEGARMTLEKAIPAGAGLGGGSSDAAASLKLLNRLHGDPLTDEKLDGLGGGLGIATFDEEEIGLPFLLRVRRREEGKLTGVDPVSVENDEAAPRLAEDRVEPDHGRDARIDEVA